MAMVPRPPRKARPPLDAARLEEAAIGYVGRYGTTRARLAAYLNRKLRERGWAGEAAPDVAALVGKLAALGYVDDQAFAAARAAALGRRGYGARRIGQALRAAGIEEADSAEARDMAAAQAWESALRFAARRKIGPFAAGEADRPGREKALAMMLRAGHPVAIARRLVAARPGMVPEPDDL